MKNKFYKNHEFLSLTILLLFLAFKVNISIFPIFKPLNSVTNSNRETINKLFNNISFFFSNYFVALEEKSQNKKLIEEKRVLVLRNALLSTYMAEVNNLKKILNLRKKYLSFNVIPILHIKGKSNNFIMAKNISNEILKEGLGVISENGIVGIIYEVNDNNIKIIPFFNPKSSIPVWVGKKNKFAFAAGNGKVNGLTLKLKYVEESTIMPKDKIVTNGYDSIFPSNIYIGEVLKIKSIRNKFFVDVDVITTTKLNSRYFYVVKK